MIKRESQNGPGLITRLVKDQTANTLAMAAASVIPLLGVVGGGVDMSRTYLAQSRLQQACDSATLAARKKLAGDVITNGNVPNEIRQTADRFFETNFTDGMYGTSNQTYTLTAVDQTRMRGDASVVVPSTIMKIFGFEQIPVSVECTAELNLPNIDVVLVLDMSGSMNNSRMNALRAAVFSFYDEMMGVAPAGARIRIGIVPYNGAVNPGAMLMAENPGFIADSFLYQSRDIETEQVQTDPGSPETEELVSDRREALTRETSNLSSNVVNDYRWKTNDSSDSSRCNAYDGEYTVGSERWVIFNDDYYGNAFSNGDSKYRGACIADVRRYRKVAAVPPTYETRFKQYIYREKRFDTDVFKTFTSVNTPTGTRGANVSSRWNGCIEERKTVSARNFDPIPAEALDLNIDLVPNPFDDDTQWKPMWPQITYDRGGRNELRTTDNKSTRNFNCPAETRRLTEYKLEGGARNRDFESYINGLRSGGGTMHDIGMLWAARIISPEGIFAADNTDAPNGEAIARHIIFMTDGEMGANPASTTAYGNYDMDGRLMGFKGRGSWTENETIPINNARLDAICDSIKNKNITNWTVSFELPLNTHTRGCASGTARAFTADNSRQLSDAFRRIASSIAELRLID